MNVLVKVVIDYSVEIHNGASVKDVIATLSRLPENAKLDFASVEDRLEDETSLYGDELKAVTISFCGE